eukprot:snap_masked-scaffold_8-processed-gene-8.15-mRNA-1 protein AED:1.00 eAED:1.00 QI:0/0/0/0/1/1/2/0/62
MLNVLDSSTHFQNCSITKSSHSSNLLKNSFLFIFMLPSFLLQKFLKLSSAEMIIYLMLLNWN